MPEAGTVPRFDNDDVNSFRGIACEGQTDTHTHTQTHTQRLGSRLS